MSAASTGAAPVPSSPAVKRGRLLCHRILDVGDEIHLERVEELLGGLGKRRVRLAREGSEALAFSVLPLDLGIGRRTLTLPRTGITVEAEVSLRLYATGAGSVLFELPIAEGTPLFDLLPLCDELYDTPLLAGAARRELAELLPRFEKAVERPSSWQGVETYTVIFVQELVEPASARELLSHPQLAKLLVGETNARRLSELERADVLKHAYSYFEDDLAVIDWNSAFVLEPSGSRDIPDILEFATAQLLELRSYDDQLDLDLQRLYDDVERARGNPWTLFWSPWGKLARGVQRRLVELTEFAERVENSLKLIGDFYLARVYRAAVRRFRIPAWQQSVSRKQALIARIYELLKGEVDIRRNTLLEATIVLLIVFEIAMAFWPEGAP